MTITKEEVKEIHDSLVEWEKKIDDESDQHQVFKKRLFILHMDEVLTLADQYRKAPEELKEEFDLEEARIVKKFMEFGK
jgi:hypothetical protein